ncbi:MAG: DUF167 domain-containing protein [Bacteroidetes bacterium]|nr:DUF167 domain-containing protein [Bacteroidota bacterium]
MIKIHAKIKPNSLKNEIKFNGDTWLIKIKAKPINGEANKYLINYLSDEINIPKSSIVIEKGNSTPFKTILLNITDKEYNTIITNFRIKE